MVYSALSRWEERARSCVGDMSEPWQLTSKVNKTVPCDRYEAVRDPPLGQMGSHFHQPALLGAEALGFPPPQTSLLLPLQSSNFLWLCWILKERQDLGRACWAVRRGPWQEGLGPLSAFQGTLHVRPVTLMALEALPPSARTLVTHLPHSLGPYSSSLRA